MQKIAVVGVGKLGICFALNLEKVGYQVIGVDVNEDYISSLNEKRITTSEPYVAEYLANSKNFRATNNITDVLNDEINTIFIMVATPSLPDGSYDHSQIERVVKQLILFGKRENLTHLVIGCTVMPGYCHELNQRISHLNYSVSYNPEFIAQGSIILGQQLPDQVLIGEASKDAGDIVEVIHRNICQNQPSYCRMDTLSAEICKIATNCFLTTKISFANSIGDLAIKAGANPHKILSAIGADSRIGSKYLNYGYGFGGPCFPRDNRALNLFARQQNFELYISQATDKVNQQHLQFQLESLLSENKSEYIFEGVAYKKDSVIIEESQQLALALLLAEKGKKVTIIDRKEVIFQIQQLYSNMFNLIEK